MKTQRRQMQQPEIVNSAPVPLELELMEHVEGVNAEDEIRALAYEIYCERCDTGAEGDEWTDWFAAESRLQPKAPENALQVTLAEGADTPLARNVKAARSTAEASLSARADSRSTAREEVGLRPPRAGAPPADLDGAPLPKRGEGARIRPADERPSSREPARAVQAPDASSQGKWMTSSPRAEWMRAQSHGGPSSAPAMGAR